MKVKIHGGTRGTTALCYSCQRAHVRKGTGYGQEVIMCNAVSYENPQQITYPIVECNDYKNAALTSLADMTKIAWFISPDKAGRAGFVVRGDKVEESMKEATFDGNPFD